MAMLVGEEEGEGEGGYGPRYCALRVCHLLRDEARSSSALAFSISSLLAALGRKGKFRQRDCEPSKKNQSFSGKCLETRARMYEKESRPYVSSGKCLDTLSPPRSTKSREGGRCPFHYFSVFPPLFSFFLMVAIWRFICRNGTRNPQQPKQLQIVEIVQLFAIRSSPFSPWKVAQT